MNMGLLHTLFMYEVGHASFPAFEARYLVLAVGVEHLDVLLQDLDADPQRVLHLLAALLDRRQLRLVGRALDPDHTGHTNIMRNIVRWLRVVYSCAS